MPLDRIPYHLSVPRGEGDWNGIALYLHIMLFFCSFFLRTSREIILCLIVRSDETWLVLNKDRIVTWAFYCENYLAWMRCNLKLLVLILDALQHHSSNIKVTRLSCVNCMVCFGDFFWRKTLAVFNGNWNGLWPGNLIFENYFAWGHCMVNLLVQPCYNLFPFLKGCKCRSNETLKRTL